jgi:hypothetical protein
MEKVQTLITARREAGAMTTRHPVQGIAVLVLASSVSPAVTSSFSRLNPTTEKLGSVASGAGLSQPWVRFDRGWSLR